MRPARLLAVAWRDLRLVHAGKAWFRLPLLALGLLLPAGALPIRWDRPPAPTEAVAAGEIPVALQDKIRLDLTSRANLSGQSPVVLTAASVPAPLRQALDSLPGPTVSVVRAPRTRPLPGRSLIVALLAISLLTGPLAESLPGERGAGTLEVLLSASVRRSELMGGKWLAWTAYGSALAALAALGGMLSGAQAPGLWPLALPLVVGVAAALGLWLVRGAADVVSGAAVPMRVLPLVAVLTGGLAWAAAETHPLLGAAVPLGGALLVASGALTGWAVLASAALGSAAAVGLLLWSAAAAIDQGGAARSGRGRDLAGGLLGVGVTWLAVAGPGLWAVAGNPNLELPLGASIAAGGVCAGLLAGVWLARAEPLGLRWRGSLLAGAGAGIVLGLIYFISNKYFPAFEGPSWMAPLRARLLRSPVEGGPLALVAVVVGQTLLFRGVLLDRLGLTASVALTVLATRPFDPLGGAALAPGLALVARRWGLLPAMVAQAVALAVAAAAGV